MKLGLTLLTVAVAITVDITTVPAQDATQPSVNVSPTPTEQTVPAETPSLSPSPTPVLPELSALDQAFNQTGLGKDADEIRTRVEMRNLQNQIARDPAVMAAKSAADTAPTDLEKRQRLREYYELNYGLMSKKASSTALKGAIEQSKNEHLAMLAQPRVRPGTGAPAPAATPKKKKKKKASHKRF